MKTKTLDRNVIQFYKGKQRKTFSKFIFSKCHHHSESKWRGLCKSSPPWPALSLTLSLTLNPNAKPSEGRKTRLQCKDLNQREGRKEEAVESSELVTDVRERRVEAHAFPSCLSLTSLLHYSTASSSSFSGSNLYTEGASSCPQRVQR